MKFQVMGPEVPQEIDVAVGRLFIAGYTGRDRNAVQAHVDELEHHGIAPPKRVPSLFAGVPARLTTQRSIVVHGTQTSGEAEFVVTRHRGELLVGIGSDHTDRELESHSIIKSKQVCEKPVSSRLWRARDLTGHWDELELLATTWTDGKETPYQQGRLAAMLPLEDLVGVVEGRVGRLDEDVVFSGTLALLTGEFVFSERFRAELRDPVLKRTLTCEYTVETLAVLDD